MRNSNLIKVIALMVILLFPTIATAEKVDCKEPGHDCKVRKLLRGMPAPFDGLLMSKDMTIYTGQLVEGAGKRLEAAITRTASVTAARCNRKLGLAKADFMVVRAERDVYKNMKEPSLIEHPAIVAAITLVSAVAVYFIAVKTIDLGRDISN